MSSPLPTQPTIFRLWLVLVTDGVRFGIPSPPSAIGKVTVESSASMDLVMKSRGFLAGQGWLCGTACEIVERGTKMPEQKRGQIATDTVANDDALNDRSLAVAGLDSQHPALIACPEKALCDVLTLRHSGKLEDAREFLEQDLRIDREHWARLDGRRLDTLNLLYRSEKIRCLRGGL